MQQPAVSRNSSVPQGALGAVSRDLDTSKGAHGRQDSSYSAMKASPGNAQVESVGSTKLILTCAQAQLPLMGVPSPSDKDRASLELAHTHVGSGRRARNTMASARIEVHGE